MFEQGDTFDFSATGETFRMLETPQETGDRYRLHVTVEPAAKGPPPHVHPGLTEIFKVVTGTLTYKVGRVRQEVAAGQGADVPPGTAHSFWNASAETAEYEVDLVFTPPGPRPEADLVQMFEKIVSLAEQGQVSRVTRMPKMLQMAVLMDHYPEAMALAAPMWLQRSLVRPLAALGRARGYKATLTD